MKRKITYKMLYDKLRREGFDETTMEWNGATKRKFQYRDQENTSIILPDSEKEIATPMHIGFVRAVLLRHGFIHESDFVFH